MRAIACAATSRMRYLCHCMEAPAVRPNPPACARQDGERLGDHSNAGSHPCPVCLARGLELHNVRTWTDQVLSDAMVVGVGAGHDTAAAPSAEVIKDAVRAFPKVRLPCRFGIERTATTKG